MLVKKKTPIIITAYCNIPDKERILYELVSDLEKSGHFIIVASHTPIEKRTQDKIDYALYEKLNVIDLTSKSYTHGVAECMLVKESLNVLKYYGFLECYKFPYDINFKGNFTFQNWYKNTLEAPEFITCWWNIKEKEIGTFGWWGKISFIEEVFTFYTNVSKMWLDGYNIEKAWGKNLFKNHADKVAKVYFYDNIEIMFPNIQVNLYNNGGTRKNY